MWNENHFPRTIWHHRNKQPSSNILLNLIISTKCYQISLCVEHNVPNKINWLFYCWNNVKGVWVWGKEHWVRWRRFSSLLLLQGGFEQIWLFLATEQGHWSPYLWLLLWCQSTQPALWFWNKGIQGSAYYPLIAKDSPSLSFPTSVLVHTGNTPGFKDNPFIDSSSPL